MILNNTILNSSIFEIENINYSVKSDLKSGLVERCKVAIHKKLKDLSVEDLRLLIGQSIALDYLVPLALGMLEKNPLIAGGLYKGDLLDVILSIPNTFWVNHIDLNNQLVEIKIEIEEISSTLSKDIIPRIKKIDYL